MTREHTVQKQFVQCGKLFQTKITVDVLSKVFCKIRYEALCAGAFTCRKEKTMCGRISVEKRTNRETKRLGQHDGKFCENREQKRDEM